MPVLGGGSSGVQGLTSAVFPLAMPPLPGFATISVKMHDVIGVTRSPFNSTTQSFEWPGDYLMATVSLPPCSKQLARAWCAFLALLRGRSGSFLLGDSSLPLPQGSVLGAPLVNGASQTGKTLVTDGWTASKTGVLRSGDWISIGSGLTQRLYMNLLDVNSDSGGNATLNLYPRLRESPANNAVITVNGAQGCFRLASNDRQFDVDNALIYGIKFDAEEAI